MNIKKKVGKFLEKCVRTYSANQIHNTQRKCLAAFDTVHATAIKFQLFTVKVSILLVVLLFLFVFEIIFNKFFVYEIKFFLVLVHFIFPWNNRWRGFIYGLWSADRRWFKISSPEQSKFKNSQFNILTNKKILNTRCDQKINVIFKLRELHMFDYVMLVHMSVIYIDNISHFGLSACFWHTGKKVSGALVSSSIFYYSTKEIQEAVLSFV